MNPGGRLPEPGQTMRKEAVPMSRRWWTLVAVSLATYMTYLDNNVTNVAIPTIQRSLHLSVSGLEWVVSSYLLVFAGLLLASCRLADQYRQAAGVPHRPDDLHIVVAGRRAGRQWHGLDRHPRVQGLGAALLVPTTLAIILAPSTTCGSAPPPSGSGTQSGPWPWRSAR